MNNLNRIEDTIIKHKAIISSMKSAENKKEYHKKINLFEKIKLLVNFLAIILLVSALICVIVNDLLIAILCIVLMFTIVFTFEIAYNNFTYSARKGYALYVSIDNEIKKLTNSVESIPNENLPPLSIFSTNYLYSDREITCNDILYLLTDNQNSAKQLSFHTIVLSYIKDMCIKYELSATDIIYLHTQETSSLSFTSTIFEEMYRLQSYSLEDKEKLISELHPNLSSISIVRTDIEIVLNYHELTKALYTTITHDALLALYLGSLDSISDREKGSPTNFNSIIAVKEQLSNFNTLIETIIHSFSLMAINCDLANKTHNNELLVILANNVIYDYIVFRENIPSTMVTQLDFSTINSHLNRLCAIDNQIIQG